EEPKTLLDEKGNVIAAAAGSAAASAARANPIGSLLLGDAGAPEQKKRWKSPPELAFEPMVDFAVPPGGVKEGEKPPPTGLSHYQEQIIAKLVGVLTDLRDSKAQLDPKVVRTAFETAFRSTSELLQSSQSGFTNPILKPLLMNPIQLGYA